MIKNYLLLLFIFSTVAAKAQYIPLSENSEVSILTIGPGSDLNDAFGHNGFRIHDEINKVDIVYDYGRYDFNTPNFYLKFARGKLLYEIGFANFEPFLNYYKSHNRWVKEQTLNLSYSEKQALFSFLQQNAKPENKKYKYDFFYDNCATRIRDVLIDVLGDKLEYKEDHINEGYTFRQLIQKNVKANSWGSLGMDIAIGAVVDQKAKPIEYQFLPEYINKGAQNAIIKRGSTEEPLVVQSLSLFNAEKREDTNNFFGSPLFVFGCLGLLIVFLTYKDFKNNSRSRITDAVIFFCTGIIGVSIIITLVCNRSYGHREQLQPAMGNSTFVTVLWIYTKKRTEKLVEKVCVFSSFTFRTVSNSLDHGSSGICDWAASVIRGIANSICLFVVFSE